MNHLSQEDIVAAYYGDTHDADEHLRVCAECRSELARLAEVLDRVSAPEVPEPPADYEARIWERLRWRMRAEARRKRRSGWMKWAAIAAVTFFAFITGLLWRKQPAPEYTQATATQPTATAAQPAASTTQQQRDRVLLVVVSDHFDRSERILVELTNITPTEDNVDIGAERAAAEELLASNRLYRTALDRGEESVATLLDELEPVLLQIAHAPDDMSAGELRRIQQRVEAKGLVFKLRVVRNDVQTSTPKPQQPNV
jgi:hypothetical protein